MHISSVALNEFWVDTTLKTPPHPRSSYILPPDTNLGSDTVMFIFFFSWTAQLSEYIIHIKLYNERFWNISGLSLFVKLRPKLKTPSMYYTL